MVHNLLMEEWIFGISFSSAGHGNTNGAKLQALETELERAKQEVEKFKALTNREANKAELARSQEYYAKKQQELKDFLAERERISLSKAPEDQAERQRLAEHQQRRLDDQARKQANRERDPGWIAEQEKIKIKRMEEEAKQAEIRKFIFGG
jgi:hypothetical protein